MKRTELERIERGLKRDAKRVAIAEKRTRSQGEQSVGYYIEQLYGLFRYDENQIFNIQDDMAILELLESMQGNLPQKKWNDVLRKAIRKAGVVQRDRALQELQEMIGAAYLESSKN